MKIALSDCLVGPPTRQPGSAGGPVCVTVRGHHETKMVPIVPMVPMVPVVTVRNVSCLA